MPERRTLVEGLKPTPAPVDPTLENDFVYEHPKSVKANATTVAPTLNRSPISTRIREDFYKALKRASLERQLNGQEPHSLQGILEEAIEPWLKNNGYLP